jgi:hypothetical protein
MSVHCINKKKAAFGPSHFDPRINARTICFSSESKADTALD